MQKELKHFIQSVDMQLVRLPPFGFIIALSVLSSKTAFAMFYPDHEPWSLQ